MNQTTRTELRGKKKGGNSIGNKKDASDVENRSTCEQVPGICSGHRKVIDEEENGK